MRLGQMVHPTSTLLHHRRHERAAVAEPSDLHSIVLLKRARHCGARTLEVKAFGLEETREIGSSCLKCPDENPLLRVPRVCAETIEDALGQALRNAKCREVPQRPVAIANDESNPASSEGHAEVVPIGLFPTLPTPTAALHGYPRAAALLEGCKSLHRDRRVEACWPRLVGRDEPGLRLGAACRVAASGALHATEDLRGESGRSKAWVGMNEHRVVVAQIRGRRSLHIADDRRLQPLCARGRPDSCGCDRGGGGGGCGGVW
mmetsp:Transcript_37640/g.103404  ORF Transcript_37640/g.103404 Transcript_37640/m.103404 type:complete len:261 (-) Transcript_37640:148-930(-)